MVFALAGDAGIIDKLPNAVIRCDDLISAITSISCFGIAMEILVGDLNGFGSGNAGEFDLNAEFCVEQSVHLFLRVRTSACCKRAASVRVRISVLLFKLGNILWDYNSRAWLSPTDKIWCWLMQ